MGSVINRGTRAKPNYYVYYKDVDGKWKMKPSKQSTKDLARELLGEIEGRVRRGLVGMEERITAPTCGVLFDEWKPLLANRDAQNDRNQTEKHLRPAFGHLRVDGVTLKIVMEWLDALRVGGELSPGSQRKALGLLSRFFSWCVERGHVAFNPVQQIPRNRRPKETKRTDTPWIDSDALVRRIFHELKEPFDLMFYLGNQSGLRTGELCGLRMSDVGFLDEGLIRVRFSYDGPLKEDKDGGGKSKFAPAPVDAADVLGDWIARRRAQGAGPEDFLFPGPSGECMLTRTIQREWARVAALPDLELDLTWYQATRHSFVSKKLSEGASLDEVSGAVGHSSPLVTRRFYDHFVRKSYSDGMRRGLGLGVRSDAKIVSIKKTA